MSGNGLPPGGRWRAAGALAVVAALAGTAAVVAPAAAADEAALSGTVRDGSGHGWPLYARVSVDGDPGAVAYTDPATGAYALSASGTGDRSVTVDPVDPGYPSRTVQVAAGASSLDVDVPVDAAACRALGYTALDEQFEDGALPPGWEVRDHAGLGQVWEFDDPGRRGNDTGGGGGFAVIDSLSWGRGGKQDTSLVSPALDLRGVSAPRVRFATDFRVTGLETADVDLSVDGGQTWANVWRKRLMDFRGPRHVTVGLPQAAGKDDVRVRWRYSLGDSDWWWKVDDVTVSDASCAPVDGGLVVGEVHDAVTGARADGAQVVVDGVRRPVITGAGSDTDDGADDGAGYFAAFSRRPGPTTVTATKPEYRASEAETTVVPGTVVRADVALDAGRLELAGKDLAAAVGVGSSGEASVDVTNTGTAPATFRLVPRDRGFALRQPDGTFGTPTYPVARGSQDADPAAVWEAVPDYPISIMDNAAGLHDGTVYSFGGASTTGTTGRSFALDMTTRVWSEIAPMPGGGRENASGAFVDGRFVAVGGYSNNRKGVPAAALLYDPAADAWTSGADSPAPRAAAGTALLNGFVYAVGGCDAASCSHTDVVAYDATLDEYTRVADYPEAVSFPACAGVDGRVFCAGGRTADGQDTRSAYVYEPSTDRWTPVAKAPRAFQGAGAVPAGEGVVVTGGTSGGAATRLTWAYRPASDTWTTLASAGDTVSRGGLACGVVRVGGMSVRYPTRGVETLPGYGPCVDSSPAASWLVLDGGAVTVQPGETVTVRTGLDATSAGQPGRHLAEVRLLEDTPYDVARPTVAMETTAPRSWVPLSGTVSGRTCEGDVVSLDRVTLALSTRSGRWAQVTGEDGRYLRWLDRADNPVTWTAGRDGFAPGSGEVRLGGRATVHDITLTETGC
ncbi:MULTISPECIES: choice-of-anchor J domain-containing protein [unclassified Isoptericola]|uniref:choice-of-anchor J domain-containing protein n=1 Tax=unclassified Isoptericola TaxID=2623355 RepID=UPI00365A0D0C